MSEAANEQGAGKKRWRAVKLLLTVALCAVLWFWLVRHANFEELARQADNPVCGSRFSSRFTVASAI